MAGRQYRELHTSGSNNRTIGRMTTQQRIGFHSARRAVAGGIGVRSDGDRDDAETKPFLGILVPMPAQIFIAVVTSRFDPGPRVVKFPSMCDALCANERNHEHRQKNSAES